MNDFGATHSGWNSVSPPGHGFGSRVSKQSVLVDLDLELCRDLAAPTVVTGNAVGVPGHHVAEQVAAEDVAPVVGFAKPFEVAVGKGNGLDQLKQHLAHLLAIHRGEVRFRRSGASQSNREGDRSHNA